jgi:hypothetical protein
MSAAVDVTGPEIAAIHAILEPAFGRVESLGQPYHGLLTGRIPGPLTLEMLVLPLLDASMALTAREVRGVFLRHAEDALDALGAAGWQLIRYPRMEFRGEVDHFKVDAWTGKLWEPSKQYGIQLSMRFEVDRPR